MEQKNWVPAASMANSHTVLPLAYVPTPTAGYRAHRKAAQLVQQPGRPCLNDAASVQTAPVFPAGSRVLLWKQDPSVGDLGVRKSFLPGVVLDGPRDARIANGAPGIPAVSPNAFGDFVMPPNTPQFDAVHTYTVVRQTLTMYQRALAAAAPDDSTPPPVPWQWNSASNTAPLQVYPHGEPDVMNAYYSRTERALRFGDFVPNGATERVYTCRSFDIVSHEAGHAILDGLKPRWLLSSNPPQTGGLHEAFGDLTAIFLALSQLDQVEAVIAQTKSDLHDKTFLADMAEEFGLALGRPNGLRNADNDLKLSEAGNEVHAISQVFTGAVYDILADIFAFERDPGLRDDAAVLHGAGQYLCSVVLRALIGAPDIAATYAHVANQMLAIVTADGKPASYREYIRNRFVVREVLEAAPLEPAADGSALRPLAALVEDPPGARQDRRTCCGTMNHAEYFALEDTLERERAALARWCAQFAPAGDGGAARGEDGNGRSSDGRHADGARDGGRATPPPQQQAPR